MPETLIQNRAEIKAQELSTVDRLMLQFLRPTMAIEPHPQDTRQASFHADTASLERFRNLTLGVAA